MDDADCIRVISDWYFEYVHDFRMADFGDTPYRYFASGVILWEDEWKTIIANTNWEAK